MQSANLISPSPMNAILVPESQLHTMAQRIAAQLMEQKPLHQGVISGDEIQSFASHQQVNAFLLFQIYQVWDERIEQLKHPFFDFASEEVQSVLDTLKNKLAHHIRIDREAFTGLLERAVANALNFIFDPRSSFRSFFFTQQPSLPVERFAQYASFFTDWDFVVNSILRFYQKHEETAVDWAGFEEKMNRVAEIYEQKKDQTLQEYRAGLYKSLTGEDLQSLLNQLDSEREAKLAAERQAKEAEDRRRLEEVRRIAEAEQARLEAERIAREEEERRRREEEEAKKRTIFDQFSSRTVEALDLDDDLLATPAKPAPVAGPATPAPAPVAEAPAPAPIAETPAPAPVAPAPEVPAAPAPVAETPASDEDKEFLEMAVALEPAPEPAKPVIPMTPHHGTNGSDSFLDRFQSAKADKPAPVVPLEPKETPKEPAASVLDQLQEKPQSIADKFAEQNRQRKLHESLSSGGGKIKLDEIAIHKQYQFVQKVFAGNNVRFRIIVDRVNDARDAAEVEDILNKFVLSVDDLDREDPVVKEFVALLRNRF